MIPTNSGRDDIDTWPGEHYKKSKATYKYIGRIQPPTGCERYIKWWEDLSQEQKKRFARVVQMCTIKADADNFDLANIYQSAIEIGMEE